MSRNGFALMAALWFLALLGSGAVLATPEILTGIRATSNRVQLLRAAWARRGCWSLVVARSREWKQRRTEDSRSMVLPSETLQIDSVEVGSGVWCSSTAADLGARLSVNKASDAMLACVLGTDVATWIRARGPFYSDEQLQRSLALRGAAAGNDAVLLTVRGTGQLNVNSAPERLLACLPGWTPLAARAVVVRRARGATIASLQDLLEALPLSSRDGVRRNWPSLERLLTAGSPAYQVTLTGHAGVPELRSTMTLVVAVRGVHLDVMYREAE